MKLLAVFAVVVIALLAWVSWPVCVALPANEVAKWNPPIAERDDTYLFGRTFQRRDGVWYQCKTRLARAFFF